MSATLSAADRILHDHYQPRMLDEAQFAVWLQLWRYADWPTLARIEEQFTPELCVRAGRSANLGHLLGTARLIARGEPEETAQERHWQKMRDNTMKKTMPKKMPSAGTGYRTPAPPPAGPPPAMPGATVATPHLPKTLAELHTGRPPKGHDKTGRRLEPHEMGGGEKC